MKILMVGNDESVHGGITTVINQFKKNNWKNKNIDFKFIPTYIEGNTMKKSLFFVVAYLKIIWHCLTDNLDIIHIHMSYRGSFFRAYFIHKLCCIFKIKDIIHLHGSEFKKWYDENCSEHEKKMVKKLLRESNKIIVLGREWEKRILSIEPLAKTEIVNNTVSIPNIKAKFNKDCFNILFLGVLIKRKGVYDLLYAISKLKDKKDLKNKKFIIAGSGNEQEKIKNKAKDLKINEYIEFTGWIDSKQKKQLLEKSQLMVLPSYNEGLPMAILEAMSYGIPVVATNVGDISEAVINEKNGFLVKAGNIEELTNAIFKIIDCNQDEWERLSNNSKKIVNEKFSDIEYFNKFETIYKTI